MFAAAVGCDFDQAAGAGFKSTKSKFRIDTEAQFSATFGQENRENGLPDLPFARFVDDA